MGKLAKELGFEFTLQDNEKLKGVSRVRSLEILLEIGNITASDAEKLIMAEKKNNWYVDYIKKMDQSELLKGAKEYITKAKKPGS